MARQRPLGRPTALAEDQGAASNPDSPNVDGSTPSAPSPANGVGTHRFAEDLSPVGRYDHERVTAAVREILIGIGEDPDRDGLRDTPQRVSRAYAEMFAGLRQDAESLLATRFDVGHDELVLVKDIEVWSCCEHHLVPFTGVAHVGYIPAVDGRVTGLSKLARLVDLYAKRPQVQERLTIQVADAIDALLQPRGVIVVFECEHLCMTMRGVRNPGSRTITSAVCGQLLNAVTRAEAMALIRS